MQNEAIYDQCTALLLAVWRAIDSDFKERYKLKIWRIYEDRICAAAGQNGTLVRFASQLARSLNAPLGRNEATRENVQTILESGADAAMLRALREETPYLILLVRRQMQILKEQWNDDE